MKPSNAELVAQLQAATEGLLFPSENEYPFKTFVFEVESQGDFTVENFLQTAGFMKPVNLDDFLQFVSEIAPESSQNYQEIINFLELYTTSSQIYRISLEDESGEYEAFHILVGNTKDGDWIGICPKIDTEPSARRSEKFLIESSTLVKESTLELKTKLEPLLAKLKFIVIEYYEKNQEKQGFVLEIADTRAVMMKKLLDSIGFVKTCAFKGFSENAEENDDPESREYFEKFKPLDELLKSRLTNLREYVIGGMAVYYLYDIGQTPYEDWVGVWTIAIWT